jgi:hypothetical protein
MLKKSINSANINLDLRKRNFSLERLSENTFASLFKIEHATVRLSRTCTDPGFCE